MAKSIGSPLRIAARVAVTAALGLVLAGAAAAPAIAAEAGVTAQAGVITKEFGRGYPNYSACMDDGHLAQRREHSDDYFCQRESNGTYTGYLRWYT